MENVDENGIDWSKFKVENGNGQFFKLKNNESAEVLFRAYCARPYEKQFPKYADGKIVLDAQGNAVIDKKKKTVLCLLIEQKDNETVDMKWEITSKSLANTIKELLEAKEDDGTPYLYSRFCKIKRIGDGKDTKYTIIPTKLRPKKVEKQVKL